MSRSSPHRPFAPAFIASLLFWGMFTLPPSQAHSQNNPSDAQLSLYTSVASITTTMIGTSLLFYTLEPEESSALLAISSCSSEMLDLTTSTHDVHLHAVLDFIEANRHGLASDLPLAHGPILSELLWLIDPHTTTSHAHLRQIHLAITRRESLLDALYTLETRDWLLLLLDHA